MPPSGKTLFADNRFFQEDPVLYLAAVICTALMILSLMLIFLGLPGTWTIIAIAAGWSFFVDSAHFGWRFFALAVGLAGIGELVEFFAGYYGAKRFGGSSKGSVGGIIGALIGGFLCAPVFFGFGALPGALAGGFIGCFLMEKIQGAGNAAAMSAAFGATLGRFGGFVVKLSIGIGIICLSVPLIWESL
ncbi:MAG: DUF456 domain-containing protein [Desulfovibrio sp.]|jgi:uncharacterized protein YqgC (DUF456 family)|nr:DUF456 domain-containing protein [Desulfovibrio sp.]